jgi:hypothetical protein
MMLDSSMLTPIIFVSKDKTMRADFILDSGASGIEEGGGESLSGTFGLDTF